jgi:hypothetical protein
MNNEYKIYLFFIIYLIIYHLLDKGKKMIY